MTLRDLKRGKRYERAEGVNCEYCVALNLYFTDEILQGKENEGDCTKENRKRGDYNYN